MNTIVKPVLSPKQWILLPTLVITSIAQPAYAVQYHTQEQVQHVLFPLATEYKEKGFLLTQAQRKAIANNANVRVRDSQIRLWEAHSAQGLQGYILIDEVTGKHDAITYAVAISTQGKLLGVEIMDYRELYGEHVRDQRWRAQFVGKSVADPIKLDEDIKNISGATLSCSHVTDGVRRLVATFEVAIKTNDHAG
ncbi:FMN-binding protein [Undibacterium sp. RTI2.1]|uniref:FMN-binding protein n=1 Tax=unclassified Undibacterium TaxID=2630295 RepID=UPI002AB58AF5|nr:MULTISPECIES: FMN-binding protein [unclassified Undibacterium]MDY7538824.1 FMN-binding protein [Undibacterium sp. 5I1]MEB0031984.1 FMN-binding protein [Undibacterium sp. RTI2.1]MEB0118193.1 FMN-binding protein [Undibacterium sp. RTI2.2]MEB0231833.1 FMN-binding protein [Undibacterium sp. 10I3]MEB0258919.1 FMN-binding protein [Undibacterium sp. 5I1]